MCDNVRQKLGHTREFILWWVSSTNLLVYFSVQLHLQQMFKNDFKMLTQLDSEIELVKSKKVYMKLPFVSERTSA